MERAGCFWRVSKAACTDYPPVLKDVYVITTQIFKRPAFGVADYGAVAGRIHGSVGHHHCQRCPAAHCGRLGRGHIARHMGDYFVCRGQCHFRAPHRLGGAPLRRSAAVFDRRADVRHHFVAVRHCPQPHRADSFPHAARPVHRSAHSVVAKPASGRLSAAPPPPRPRLLGHDGDYRADSGPDYRRLYQRPRPMGLDFLHQRAHRHPRLPAGAAFPERPRNPNRTPPHRHGRAGADGAGCGQPAIRARPRPRSRLVFVQPDCRHVGGGGGGPVVFHRVGTGHAEPDCRFAFV